MAVESAISPEYCCIPSVQCHWRHSEEAQKYQSVTKRSSKDWFPPEMALMRSTLLMKSMIMAQNAQWTVQKDILATYQELGGDLEFTVNLSKKKRCFLHHLTGSSLQDSGTSQTVTVCQ